jgi:hypothetical protein
MDGREERSRQGAVRYVLAVTFWQRCRGLLGRPVSWLGQDELVLVGCHAVHMLGMREQVDVAFAAADGTVLKVVPRLGPGRFARCSGAYYAVERFSRACRPAGDAWYCVGDKLPFARYAGLRRDA